MSNHLIFDFLAWTSAFVAGITVYKWRIREFYLPAIEKVSTGYFVSLAVGAVGGAFLFGSLNLIITGKEGLGRSVVGALFGAIVLVEIYKKIKGIKLSTGIVYVVPLTVSIAIGRLGCHFAGIDDFTYGKATDFFIRIDLGDGVLRHPVQLYESSAMLLFLLVSLYLINTKNKFFITNSFYLFIGWYSAQRFVLEFLKPYGTLAGPFNIFHFVCAVLAIYSIVMIKNNESKNNKAVIDG